MKKYPILLLTALLMACSNSDDPQGLTEACNTPTGPSAQVTSTDTAVLSWSQSGANQFRVEYGEAGFNIGSGTQTTTTELAITISGLDADTSYQFYVQADCGQFQSERNGPVLFQTPPCPEVSGIFVEPFSITATGAQVSWNSEGVSTYQIEYGPAGFALGEGTQVNSSSSVYDLEGLTPETDYELYVRSVCGSNTSLFSGPVAFTTQSVCPSPLNFEGAEVGSDYIIVTWDFLDESLFEVEFGAEGFEPGSGTSITVDFTFAEFYGLGSSTSYDFYIRTNCGLDGFSPRVGPLTLTTNP